MPQKLMPGNLPRSVADSGQNAIGAGLTFKTPHHQLCRQVREALPEEQRSVYSMDTIWKAAASPRVKRVHRL